MLIVVEWCSSRSRIAVAMIGSPKALQNPIKRDYWISVILTGGRRSQKAESEWEHIDFGKATWHFPKPKGGTERAYTIPVSKYLLGRLQKRKGQNDALYPGSKWVFPSEKVFLATISRASRWPRSSPHIPNPQPDRGCVRHRKSPLDEP